MKSSQRSIALILMMVLAGMTLLHYMNLQRTSSQAISFSEFVAALEADGVESVSIQEEDYQGKFNANYKEGAFFTTVGPLNSEKALELLTHSSAKVEYKKPKETPFWQNFLIYWLPMLLLFGFLFFSMRQIQVGGGKAMSFGRSKAKLLSQDKRKVTFQDVAGIEEAKSELEEIIAFLKDPKRFTRLGGRIPKGVLLVGSPGTGKTLLARAIAGEAGVPFFSISGSDFVEMFVGVGAARVRDLFEQGKKHAPCIVFIDEIDAVGRHRGSGLGGGHDEREQTLNQLLVEMDGFESNEGVIIIAATNRPDVLDPALLRPGRFDRQIHIPRPDVKGREAILKVHTRKLIVSPDLDLAVIARGTPGFSGAELENVANEAALVAGRNNKKEVAMADFEAAKDKVLMGTERRSLIITDEEKRNTAYHEAGHALVARLIPGTDPIHKVTIIPRGAALGLTQQLPTSDRFTHNRQHCENTISILMGGRAAEEIIFNQPTTGAGNDIERATDLARKMVCEWGMSPKLGPMSFGKKDEVMFLGRDLATHQDISDDTAQIIDQEVRKTITDNFDRAKRLLTENIDTLHRMAEGLLERESLDADMIDLIIAGKPLPPMKKAALKESEDPKQAPLFEPQVS